MTFSSDLPWGGATNAEVARLYWTQLLPMHLGRGGCPANPTLYRSSEVIFDAVAAAVRLGGRHNPQAAWPSGGAYGLSSLTIEDGGTLGDSDDMPGLIDGAYGDDGDNDDVWGAEVGCVTDRLQSVSLRVEGGDLGTQGARYECGEANVLADSLTRAQGQARGSRWRFVPLARGPTRLHRDFGMQDLTFMAATTSDLPTALLITDWSNGRLEAD